MSLPKRKGGVVVVQKSWANLNGVKLFLLHYERDNFRELEGEDDSFAIFADILNSDDPHGVWIELHTAKHAEDKSIDRQSFLIPWSQVITIVIGEKFSPEIVQESKKFGYSIQS